MAMIKDRSYQTDRQTDRQQLTDSNLSFFSVFASPLMEDVSAVHHMDSTLLLSVCANLAFSIL